MCCWQTTFRFLKVRLVKVAILLVDGILDLVEISLDMVDISTNLIEISLNLVRSLLDLARSEWRRETTRWRRMNNKKDWWVSWREFFRKGKIATRIDVDQFGCFILAIDHCIAWIKQFLIQMTLGKVILLGLGLGWIALVLTLFFKHLLSTLRELLSSYT